MLVPSDVFQQAHCKELVALTVKEFGKIDLLVTNATFQASHGLIGEIGAEEWGHAFRTNIYAYSYLLFDRQMQPDSIIATLSMNANTRPPKLVAYATSKGAIANDRVWSTRPCVMKLILRELTFTTRPAAQELRAGALRHRGTMMGDHVG